jgi:hypothetical protein
LTLAHLVRHDQSLTAGSDIPDAAWAVYVRVIFVCWHHQVGAVRRPREPSGRCRQPYGPRPDRLEVLQRAPRWKCLPGPAELLRVGSSPCGCSGAQPVDAPACFDRSALVFPDLANYPRDDTDSPMAASTEAGPLTGIEPYTRVKVS